MKFNSFKYLKTILRRWHTIIQLLLASKQRKYLDNERVIKQFLVAALCCKKVAYLSINSTPRANNIERNATPN